MPYIEQSRRFIWASPPARAESTGELNYIFTQIINQYRLWHGDSYSTFNDILGALEGAKLEFYRRVVVPYEEKKREENGDVYAAGR